jgi:putative ABC transport system permease protein
MEGVNSVLAVITGTVTAIAAISLLVGAIGIFTILWIVVRERSQEIGLIQALGATKGQVLAWYLCEAAATAGAGGLAGFAVGAATAYVLGRTIPALEAFTPVSVVIAALTMAVAVGLVAGVGPAWRAASLDPIEALRAE